MEKEKRFAEGFNFYKYFWVFIFGSVFGAYYEQISYYLLTWIQSGHPVWSLRRGVIFGPFNIIYGIGSVLMVALLCKKKRPVWKTFIYGSLLGGLVEFICGWGYSFVFRDQAWDYSDHLLNFNGWTSIPIMLIWGFCTILLVKFIYPNLSKLIESAPPKFGRIITIVFAVFMFLDMTVSWTALFRQTMRREGYAPYTAIGEFYDQYFTDEFLEKYFPNTTSAEKRQ